MSRFVAFAVFALFVAVGGSAGAQVIYEPVTYQYFSGGRAYYYGGSDSLVHYNAKMESHESGFGRSNGYAFHSGNIDTHREVSTEPARVYTDAIPTWNGHVYGYTADDARNAAYANSATYFRKADVAKMARLQGDGTWLVPAQAGGRGTIEIKPYRAVAPAGPESAPKPILSIPKRLLDKKLWGEGEMRADAR